MTATATRTKPDPLASLNGRGKGLDRSRWSYKLAESQYGLDIVIPDQDFGIDESKMSAWVLFADGHRRDGVGDLIEVGGIDIDRHRKNPIVLMDHGKGSHKFSNWPIGLAEDRDTKRYTVEIDPVSKQAKCNVFFYDGSGVIKSKEFLEYCEQIFDLWCKKFFRAGSIGYQVKAAQELRADYQEGIPQGLHLLKTLMLEASIVTLPANADTVCKLLDKSYRCCGKKLSPYLVKSLTPYAPQKKVQMGYEPPAEMKDLREKYRKKGGSIPLTANVSDFVVGDKVVARSYLSFIGSDGKTGTFAKPGDRLTIVGTSGPMWVCKRDVDGMTAPFGSVHIRKTKGLETKAARQPAKFNVGDRVRFVDGNQGGVVENRSEDGRGWVYNIAVNGGGYVTLREEELRDKGKSLETQSKSLDVLRKKYRGVKTVRRRMKCSSPGSSVLHVSAKDLEKLQQDAEAKGLKFERMGESGANVKIKLTGSDDSIDAVAKEYGRPIMKRVKSMSNKQLVKKVKAAPEDMNGDGTVNSADVDIAADVGMDDGVDTGEGDQSTKKYSAQILERMHEDASILLEEYEEMKGPLENKKVEAFIVKKLESIVAELDEIEGLHAGEHPDEEPLGGQKDLDADGDEDGDTEADVETNDDAVEADSSEEDEPSPEEALEGMETKDLRVRYLKSLRARYKMFKVGDKVSIYGGDEGVVSSVLRDGDLKVRLTNGREVTVTPGDVTVKKHLKAMCPDCNKGDCKCGSKDLDAAQQMDSADETEQVQNDFPDKEKDLEPHEKEKVGEAAGYLKDLSETQDFNDEHRMKSYHFHKSLDPMSMVGMGGGEGEEQKSAKTEIDEQDDKENVQHKDGMNIPNPMDMVGGGEGDQKGMCRKSIGDASRFFKALSTERNFGDNHRQEALTHHKALDPISREDEATNVNEGGTPSPEVTPGEMGEKKLKGKKKVDTSKVLSDALQQNKLLLDLAKETASLLKAVG